MVRRCTPGHRWAFAVHRFRHGRIKSVVPRSAGSSDPSNQRPPFREPRWAVVTAFLVPVILLPALAVLLLSHGSTGGSSSRVTYAQIQALFDRDCTACHPGVNPSIDLRPGHSYASLINQRALEDPRYLRVVVGDPQKSFLYLKVAGFAPAGQVGGRMPFGRGPLPTDSITLLRDWILQGARGPTGALPPAAVSTPGSEPPLSGLPLASRPTGTGTITGTVIDQQRKPIKGALVTLLLRGPSQPGGEEHYRVAVTNAAGRYSLLHAPAGTFELKAYAPKRIYVSHFVAPRSGATTTVDFGLPDRALSTPTISDAKVRPAGTGETLSMTVRGPNLDRNYTLAANPASGRVFELHSPGDQAGTWSRTIPDRLGGPWIFVAVDHLCSVSSFITIPG
jgi:Carboxypeptidase regulatory-like domain